MYYLVYETTNNINGKIYVGAHQTIDLNDGYLGSGKYFTRAVKKYGEENFSRKILFEFNNIEDMYLKEGEIVDEDFVKRADTYNIKVGGQGGFNYINSHKLNLYKDENGKTLNGVKIQNFAIPFNVIKEKLIAEGSWEEYKQKHKEGILKYINSEEYTPSFLGKTHSEETKRLIGSKSKIHQAGAGNSQFGTMWITDGASSLRFRKDDDIPDGWKKGRLSNLLVRQQKLVTLKKKDNKIEKEMLQIKIQLEKKAQQNREKEEKRRIKNEVLAKKKIEQQIQYQKWYEIYRAVGFKRFVAITGYKYSKQNLVMRFAALVPEFVPQNGKRRGKA